MARTKDNARAFSELYRLQERLVAKYSSKVWGRDHPKAIG